MSRFDDRIHAAPPTDDLSEPPQWYPLPEVKGLVVLELKYTGSYPGWVADLVRRFNLQRNSMSKYKQGVDVLREMPGLMSARPDVEVPGSHRSEES